MDSAAHYYQLADSIYHVSLQTGLYEEYYARISSNYLRESKQYEKALEQVDTLMALFHSVSDIDYNEAFAKHAEIIHFNGS